MDISPRKSVTTGTVQAAIANFNAITQERNLRHAEFYGSVGRSFSSHVISKHQTSPPITQPDFFVRPSPTRNSSDRGRSSLRMSMLPSKSEDVLKVYNFSDDSEALDSLNFDSKCSLNVMRRREPLGASGNKPEKPKSPPFRETPQVPTTSIEVVIPNEKGPLGIHVVPCDDDGRLVVQGIEPGGRIDRHGHLAVGDEIIAINGISLIASTFTRAQEIFKEALSAKDLCLGVVKGSGSSLGDREEMAVEGGDDKENKLDAANHTKAKFFDASTSTTGTLTKMAAGTKITTAVNANNTRKIGKVIRILLKKGPLGLGFSITTRDNAPGGNTPIYIKNILPKGAAIEEGTLKPGDRLLEVNGVSVDGMSQSEVVALLRNAPLDSSVRLVVSRHLVAPSASSPSKIDDQNSKEVKNKKLHFKDEETTAKDENPLQSNLLSPTMSAKSSSSPVGISSSEEPIEEFQFPWKQREILTFDIPVHDSERAGLGVSVKGKTSTSKDGTVVDLGIFVKSVLHGGAASRDGRLKTNDQLVNINGISLLGKANPNAMETLRKAMHEEGPMPGIISLTVARRRYEDVDQLCSNSSAATSLSNNSGSLQNQREESDRPDSLSSSSDDAVREYRINHQQETSSRQISFAPFKVPGPPTLPPQSSASSLMSSSLKHVRNPVVDRLMGKESAGLVPSNLRNDSYYMATHQDTWNGGIPMTSPPHHPISRLSSQQHQSLTSTMHPSDVGDGVIMIEQDDYSKTTRAQDEPMDDDDNRTTTTHESLTSLVDVYPTFSRDQPGRQSMSEKRHATLDAKSTDTYQKRKKAREEKMKENAQKLLYKKSASLESLQMIGAKPFLDADDREALRNAYVRANSVRVARNRGCNESFRAAVDRSYEKDFPESEPPDFAIEDLDDDCFEPDSGNMDDVPETVMRRSKSERDTPSKKKNRNSKLFKGLGTMFRIGSKPSESSAARRSKSSSSTNRKSLPGPLLEPSSPENPLTRQQHVNSGSQVDYRQNFHLSKSRSGDLSSLPTRAPTHQKRQAPPPPAFIQNPIRGPGPHHPHHIQPRRPGEMYAYEYFPSAMMRPGSRVGIADPAQLTTESADYDVIQRLQHRSQSGVEPPMRYSREYNPTYEQVYGSHRQFQQQRGAPQHHGVHLGMNQGQLVQVHLRTGSNLSSGSSTQNNLNTSSGSAGSAKGQRPKSNFYDYDFYNIPSVQQQHFQYHDKNTNLYRGANMYQ